MVKYLLIFLLLLSSCIRQNTNNNIPVNSDVSPHASQSHESYKNAEVIIPNFKWEYNDTSFINVYGVEKERIINIISEINPIHFEGISTLEVIYSKAHGNADCWYYSDNSKIKCYIDYQGDEWLKRNILHELKHNFCLTKERDDFDNCLKHNPNKIITDGFDNSRLWDYCYHDEGCFLSTPIDKEYGFII